MRRSLALLMTLLVLAGCGRVAPDVSTAPATASTAPPLVIAASADETTSVIAQLYLQAMAEKGIQARIVTTDDNPSSTVARIRAGEVDVAPVFAWTAAQALKVDNDEPGSMVSDLAAALDGEVAVLQASEVNRAWIYRTASDVTSLDAVTDDTTVVGPAQWRNAPDGPTGLAAVYGVHPKVQTADAAADRLTRAVAGDVVVFDGTEPQATDPRLKPVADPRTMTSPDLQVALLALNRQDDEALVGVLAKVQAALDNAAIVSIRQQAVSVGVEAAVTDWLKAHPLG